MDTHKIRRFFEDVVLFACIFVVYFITGKLGLQMAILNESVTAVWAPTGIAIATLILYGLRVWPSIFLAAFLVNFTTAGSVVSCLGIALGNTLEGIVGAYLVNRFAKGRRAFEQPHDIVTFVFLAGVVSTMVSATIGVLSLSTAGRVAQTAWPTWITWWAGDMAGAFTVAPLLILWSENKTVQWTPKKAFEAAALLASLCFAALVVFNDILPGMQGNLPLAFLCAPFLLWASFRFGQREAALSTLVLFSIAIVGTLRGLGPYGRLPQNEALLILQIFIGMNTITAQIIGAVVLRRKKAEESLRYLVSIVENSEEAITSKTLEGIITSWNKGAQAIYGYTPQETIGHPVSMLYPPDHAAEEMDILRRLAKGETIEKFETRRVRKDGAFIDVSLTISPIINREGVIQGASTIAQDITARKELEMQKERHSRVLSESNIELGRREKVMRSLLEDINASKVTLEQQKKSLLDANQRLEALGKLKDEFVATVSHELRTPLTAIKEGISLLIDRLLGPLNEEQNDFLTTVDMNIDRLTELINNMLDLSKIEAGRLRMSRRRVDILALVRETLQNYSAMAGKRTIKTYFAETSAAFADSARVIQILGNLFSNAVKFTDPEGTITVSASEESPGQVAVTVEDNGVGIAKDDLSKLFKKFSQVGQKRTQGTGLGLALCKELVEMQKGSIRVTSEPGQSTRFTFTLPLYTPKMAMEEYFKEQLQWAEQNKRDGLGVILLEADTLLKMKSLQKMRSTGDPFDDVEMLLRAHLHDTDIVCWPKPDQLMILSIANASSLLQTVRRITSALSERMAAVMDKKTSVILNFGTAQYPSDGTDVHALYRAALSRLNPLVLAAEYP